MGQLVDRLVHKSDIVDGILLHSLEQCEDVHFSNEDMVVLENQNEGLRVFGHHVSYVLRETVSLSSLLYYYVAVLFIFLF